MDTVQGGLENIGQVRGSCHRFFGSMVTDGCQDKCEVDRVVHGSVLSLRECIHPLLKARRRLLQAFSELIGICYRSGNFRLIKRCKAAFASRVSRASAAPPASLRISSRASAVLIASNT